MEKRNFVWHDFHQGHVTVRCDDKEKLKDFLDECRRLHFDDPEFEEDIYNYPVYLNMRTTRAVNWAYEEWLFPHNIVVW